MKSTQAIRWGIFDWWHEVKLSEVHYIKVKKLYMPLSYAVLKLNNGLHLTFRICKQEKK